MKTKPVTAGTNGYPTPEIGIFHFGYDNINEILAAKKELNGEIIVAHWKDGWNFCEIKIADYFESGFTPDFHNYGDDWNIINSAEEMEKELEYLLESDFPENLISKFKKEVELIDWDNFSIRLSGLIWEEIPKISFTTSFDTHNYAIGVLVRH